jgi:UDP-N-acetyl-D-mannosaminuronate dehydrogenase
MKIGIIGYGEIGKALEKLYLKNQNKVSVKDIDRDDGLDGSEIINICLPYSDFFVSDTCFYIKEYQPRYTVIHSTIPPSTTQKISEATKSKVVHSPVRGVHPELLEGLLTFEKYIGADFDCVEIANHFEELGVKTKIVSPKTSELAKLFSTSYYGLCIAWHGEMKKMCDSLGVNFEDAVTDWNKNYNESYKKLNKSNVVRPLLYPSPQIGGHCIIPNAKILREEFDSTALDLILEYS